MNDEQLQGIYFLLQQRSGVQAESGNCSALSHIKLSKSITGKLKIVTYIKTGENAAIQVRVQVLYIHQVICDFVCSRCSFISPEYNHALRVQYKNTSAQNETGFRKIDDLHK